MPAYKTVTAYLAAQTPAHRAILAKVRKAIRDAAPDATEGISYQMPVYKLGGKMLIYFAAWKQHWALYPSYTSILEAVDLTGYEVSKGAIKFPWSAPPVKLIGKITKLRAKQVRAAAKVPAKKRAVRGTK